MRMLLVLFLLISLDACASGRMDRMEDRIVSLEQKLASWETPPFVFDPGNWISWPTPLIWPINDDSDIVLIPSAWPIEQPVPGK